MLRLATHLLRGVVPFKRAQPPKPTPAAASSPTPPSRTEERELRLRLGASDPSELQRLATETLMQMAENPRLPRRAREAVKAFLAGKTTDSVEKALALYKAEFENTDPKAILTTPAWEEAKKRPQKELLTLMLQALGPENPLTLEAQTKLRCLFTTDPVTPMRPRYLEARRGGLPRRLLNGHWMWEGGHWSIKNKNKMGSGFESNMFDRVGVF